MSQVIVVVMNYETVIDDELANLTHLLNAVPFSPRQDDKDLEHFLSIYRLNYRTVNKIVSSSQTIDSTKLFKLGISLGNLMKSFQVDQELYSQQNKQNKNPTAVGKSKGGTRISYPGVNSSTQQIDSSLGTPFQELFQSPRHVVNSGNQPIFQVRFVKNLLSILKNFDIGVSQEHSETAMSNSQLNSTIYQMQNLSPIRLNSRQLLIEKLETNIKVDTLFTYKVVFQLLVKIYITLKESISTAEFLDGNTSNGMAPPITPREDTSSIFSLNSTNSSESSTISINEYHRLLRMVINRVVSGLVSPFVRLLLNEVVENRAHEEFTRLIDSL